MTIPVQAPQTNYRPDIDGLRAIAVLSVVVFHAFPSAAPGGFVGVDVFFVISGYLISRIIFSGLDRGTFSFGSFYAHRVKRIFPALVLVLAACYALGWFLLLPEEFAQLGKHMAAGAGFVQNVVLWREDGNYFNVASDLKPLLHLWSLAVEEQFYMVYPLLIWASWRAGLNVFGLLLVVMLASFGLNIWRIWGHQSEVFFLSHTRFWELLAGGVLAYVNLFHRSGAVGRGTVLRNSASVVGLPLILVPVFYLDRAMAFPGWWALLPVAGSWLLIFAGGESWVNRHLLASRFMVFVGLISYPLYLWHWPLLSFLRIVELEPTAAQRAAAAVLSFLAAWITYRVVERPVRFGRGGNGKVYVLTALLVIVGYLGWNAYDRHGLGFRFPAEIRPVATYTYDYKVKIRDGTCWLSSSAPADAFSPVCLGPAGAHPAVLIWGDSHAGRLYFGFDAGANVALFARDSCPPTLGYEYPVCIESNQHVLSVIAKQRPDTVVMYANWDAYDQRWQAGRESATALLSTVAQVKAAGVKNIVVMGPAPRWAQGLPKLAFTNWLREKPADLVPQRMGIGLLPVAATVDMDLKALIKPDFGVRYFSVQDALCNVQGCLVRTSDDPTSFTTWDYGHLTTTGAAFVVERLRAGGMLPAP